MRVDDLGQVVKVKPVPGPRPATVGQLSRVQDRITFLYLEHAIINRDANALTVQTDRGTVHVPAATLSTLLLGPGTTISQPAMVLLADSGTAAVWTGEQAVRYYAHGRPLARTSRLLESQATLVSNRSSRLAVARQMYAMRFPLDDVSDNSMQQLRGREGARVRRLYREQAEDAGVEWRSRSYRPGNWQVSDDVNAALTMATQCLYGLVHTVVVSLGCSPGLGFIHTGHDRSFVYDIADLYKMEVAVPTAFRVVAEGSLDIEPDVRHAMRDAFHDSKLLATCVRDIHQLLGSGGELETDFEADIVQLWDTRGAVAAGQNHFEEEPW